MNRIFLCINMLSVLFVQSSLATSFEQFEQNAFGRLTSSVWRYQKQFSFKDLTPVPNNNPYPEPQPQRDRPQHVALNAQGSKLYVTLAGTEEKPGRQVAVIDIAKGQVIKRLQVGLRPYALVLHPQQRFLVVTNELSNYASVIDTITDEVTGQIPLDYYCQGLVFSQGGRQAWVANRYLDQALLLDVEVQTHTLQAKVRVVGGFDEQVFYGTQPLSKEWQTEIEARGLKVTPETSDQGGINKILRARCSRCHNEAAGGFVSGPHREMNFLSAVENSVPGKPFESILLRAVIPQSLGGFGDQKLTSEFHPGGVLFEEHDPELQKIVEWIQAADNGPGIVVGNPQSHPKDLVMSSDEKYLFVGNTGTMDVAVIDTATHHLVGALYIQNLANSLALFRDEQQQRDFLIILSFGAGFGTAKERDPLGAETWDRTHPAAQFSVLRDPHTTDAYPIEQQFVLGPFDAVDGTWNIKMRDIQNDLITIDLSSLDIPPWSPDLKVDYLLKANRYEAHSAWVRYTSDTAEATTGDVKGDIPPELQRVHGAFPEGVAIHQDKMYITMAGTFEVVEWQIHPEASDPTERFVPMRVFKTGLRPMGLTLGTTGPAKNHLFIANELEENISVIHLLEGSEKKIVLSPLSRPPLDTDAEKGELIVHSTVFSSDGDTSCLHCHYRDTGDGRGWGAAETIGQNRQGHFTPGGTLGIPQMKNIYAIQPFYFEGTHRLSEGQGADINEPASSIDFDRPIWQGDFTSLRSHRPAAQRKLMHEELKERVSVQKLGERWYDLEERRDEFIRRQSMAYFGAAYNLTDLYRLVSTWMGNTPHLFPNPFDRKHPSVLRGQALFQSPQVMCSVCHTFPEFTNKTRQLADNDRRALPPLTTITRRDASYTLAGVRAVDIANGRWLDLAPEDLGRVETPEGTFTTMQLRGIFDRPPVFLHHGRARSLAEAILTPEHKALRQFRLPVLQGDEEVRPHRQEQGFNETTHRLPSGELDKKNRILDSHGGTSHLTVRQANDLINFIKTIE